MQAVNGFVLYGAQVRAARALLRWSSEELAQRAKLGTATIKRAEAHDGPVTSTTANIQAMRDAFEKAGLEFIPENGGGAGVRFRDKKSSIVI
jgi:ribosome-binding protein aMBF1 (putative translation factor)